MRKLKVLIYILIPSLCFPPFIEIFSLGRLFAQTGGSVSVSASVTQTVTCTPSANSTSFGNIDTSAVFTSSPNITTVVSCNPGGGCKVEIKDQGDGTNGGLYKSTSPTYLIPSPANGFPNTATLQPGTDGYGIQAATTTSGSGGILSLNPIYNQTGNTVGKLTTTFQTLASSSQPVANREVVVTHKVAVSALAPAGDYSDTITYQCSAN